jgi:zinc D-Ala-D-Ala carboxypeptidase
MIDYCGPTAKAPWDASRWPNFTAGEIACRCCGEVYINEAALDALQRLRDTLGGPLTITSGHRCRRHNRAVGGAAGSAHLKLAFDLALGIHPRSRLLAAARQVGFQRFGLMEKGLHVDTHPLDASHAPIWTYGARAREAWHGCFPENAIDIGG